MKRFLGSVIALACYFTPHADAAVSLVDKDDWKVSFGGFVEMDTFNDDKRSLTEVVGNTPIDRADVNPYSAKNGRTQMSIRNSRMAFTVLAPEQNGWKTKGYLEYDLLGYMPSPAPGGQSESGYFTNAALRVRHAYMSAEQDGYAILVGQYWSLFGFEPNYVLTTASVPPAPGVIYQRTPQVTLTKSLPMGEDGKLLLGVSVARPSQRDSSTPNLEAGAKYSWAGRKGGFSSPSSDITLEPLSVGVSGTMRKFVISSAALDGSTSSYTGSALAVDALIPLLPAHDSADGSLTLTAEMSTGSGDADSFPGWTGNLSALGKNAPAPAQAAVTALDAGQGGFLNGSFQLVTLKTWNAQLQYHLPMGHNFVTAGYGELSASNVNGLLPVAAGAGILYDKSQVMFANLFHDCTKQLRAALEYSKMSTHYVDGVSTTDNRYQLSAYYRF